MNNKAARYTANDGKTRCSWCETHPLYVKYHDEEWGVPVHDDRKHFESIVLDGAQAGLSWFTILSKRKNYRKAFDNFDVQKIANYGDKKLMELLANPGIVRNKLKIKSAISNAQAFIKIQEEFGSFDEYIWRFVDGETIHNDVPTMSHNPVNSELSDEISKDLRKRGFSFVGSTIIYAYMQAAGLVDDHLNSCWRKGARS